MAVPDRVRVLIEPLVDASGASVYDVVFEGGVLRVTVDAPGGIDLERITELTRLISSRLDDSDPTSGSYTLEVSSPGLERTLRTSAHFQGAVGTTVKIKTNPDVEGDRRLVGVVRRADHEQVEIDTDHGLLTLRYPDIQRARTVFEWGSERPEPKRKKKRSSA